MALRARREPLTELAQPLECGGKRDRDPLDSVASASATPLWIVVPQTRLPKV